MSRESDVGRPPGAPGLIVIVGGESTGKSTLARAAAGTLPALVVPEALRDWVDRHGRVPGPDEQSDVMAAQVRLEHKVLASAAHTAVPWAVSDAGPLMTAVYSRLYHADDALLDDAVRLTSRAHLVVWCDDDIPWVPDVGQRDGVHMRAAAQGILAEVLADSPLRWIKVSGSPHHRVAAVQAALGMAPETD